MRTIKSCGVLVFRSTPVPAVLLMRHADRWDLPKGHVDPGETELKCALRELEEETGICPEDVRIDPDFRFEHQYRVWPAKFDGQECLKTLVIFLGYLKREVEIQPTEHPGFRWLRWDPPQQIQEQTVDPLLAQFAEFLDSKQD